MYNSRIVFCNWRQAFMKATPGTEYLTDIQVKAPIFGWVKIATTIDVDSETSFHGSGKVMGRTVNFNDGVIEGEDYLFQVTIKSMVIKIRAQLHEDDTITGEAHAPKYRPLKVRGTILSKSTIK